MSGHGLTPQEADELNIWALNSLLLNETKTALLAGDEQSALAIMRAFFKVPSGEPSSAPSGFVYVVLAEGIGRYKIGFSSNDPSFRVAALQTGSPVPLRLVASIPQCSKLDEMAIHHRFDGSRLHGEWFSGTAELLSFIEAHKIP